MRIVDEKMEHTVPHFDVFFLIPLDYKSMYKN